MSCSNYTNPSNVLPSALVSWTFNAVAGGLGVCANLITLAVIGKSKKMRSPCFGLLAGASVPSLLTALGYFITHVGRLGDWGGLWSMRGHYRGTCLLMCLYGIAGVVQPASAQTVALVALDRMFGTLAPHQYRMLGKRYAIVGLSVCASLSILEGLLLVYMGGRLDRVLPTCTLPEAIGASAVSALHVSLMVFEISSALFYLAMFICTYVRNRKMKRKVNGGFATQSMHLKHLKQQAVIMPAARMLAILYVVTGVVPDITLNFLQSGGLTYLVLVHFKALGVLVEFTALMSCCEQFRRETLRMLKRKSNQVSAM